MNITIEVSESVPEDAFGRVQALARRVVVSCRMDGKEAMSARPIQFFTGAPFDPC
ncbi:hypothetical protein [Acidovorax sp. LjRoot117]|uniref:hypothetical protein n=1 Tax=Acidovorax sp. LjRoot117 TaxID=3342255 RepID=UPI003ECF24E9